jgi:hypothetical protein
MRIDGEPLHADFRQRFSGELAAALGACASAEARARGATLPPQDALAVMKGTPPPPHPHTPATTQEPLTPRERQVRPAVVSLQLLLQRNYEAGY